MTDKERVYWRQINEDYMTAESSDEENEIVKCHHLPWASNGTNFDISILLWLSHICL